MVLPDRIELSASPLPRECSTTELRQQDIRAGPDAGSNAIGSGSTQGLKLPIGERFRRKRNCTVLERGTMTQQGRDKSGAAAAREQRLAAKLRENLARRKAQARARRAGEGVDPAEPTADRKET